MSLNRCFSICTPSSPAVIRRLIDTIKPESEGRFSFREHQFWRRKLTNQRLILCEDLFFIIINYYPLLSHNGWVFNLLNLFLLHEVVISLLDMFAYHLVFISFFCVFLVFKYVVHCVLFLPDEVRPM